MPSGVPGHTKKLISIHLYCILKALLLVQFRPIQIEWAEITPHCMWIVHECAIHIQCEPAMRVSNINTSIKPVNCQPSNIFLLSLEQCDWGSVPRSQNYKKGQISNTPICNVIKHSMVKSEWNYSKPRHTGNISLSETLKIFIQQRHTGTSAL